MKISCVIARAVSTEDADKLREIGPLYGSWTTWKENRTDNVVCTDLTKAYELLQKAFHAVCNFHIPEKFIEQSGTLPRVQSFDYLPEVVNSDDLAAVHIASVQDSAVVLLLGFDFLHKDAELIRLIKQFSTIQYVGVTTPTDKVSRAYASIDNITFDTLENVLIFADANT